MDVCEASKIEKNKNLSVVGVGKGVFLLVFLEWVGNLFSSVADLLWYSFASAPFTAHSTGSCWYTCFS